MIRTTAVLIGLATLVPRLDAFAQASQPHRQFVTISIDRPHTFPLHFKDHPLEDLTARALNEVQGGGDVDYRSDDGRTTVDVLEFGRRGRGGGIMVYPFGSRNGLALAVRASYETLPVIRLAIMDGGATTSYNLRDGRAYDLGAGFIVSDRPPAWGLGTHSFALAGVGRVRGERGDGDRVFGEAGGGVSVGPVGVQFSVKVAYNKLSDPRAHAFFTVPLTLRGTLSF
ncbi:MAG: hypothetical protein HYZ58_11895 [Acidobacteria bacterium]|nr:hypothetical protein [Acidobacteriota bacterium]MBI3263837.1 hypothetical protein [Acidobacteriota bacterium]